MGDLKTRSRTEVIDLIARDLKQVGNDAAYVDYLANSAKSLLPGTPVHIPGRPFCVGYVSQLVSENLCIYVSREADDLSAAFFGTSASNLVIGHPESEDPND